MSRQLANVARHGVDASAAAAPSPASAPPLAGLGAGTTATGPAPVRPPAGVASAMATPAQIGKRPGRHPGAA